MRSLKKLVSILLIACTIVIMLPASLEAAEPQLRFSDPSTTQGATFNVDATFYADDIGSVRATLTYDTSSLKFISGDNATDNGGQIQIGKELRWPFLNEGDNYGDYYIGDYQTMYVYKKYSYNKPEDLIDRLRCPTDWPLIRYTDVALQLAEAYVHVGRAGDAVDIVNQIRSRAGMPPVSTGTDEQVMEAIRYERRVELCLEGHDFFDEWRWGTYKEMKFQGQDTYGGQNWWGEWEGYNYNWYYTDDMYPWGAPAGECQRNPNLKQKPGWAY